MLYITGSWSEHHKITKLRSKVFWIMCPLPQSGSDSMWNVTRRQSLFLWPFLFTFIFSPLVVHFFFICAIFYSQRNSWNMVSVTFYLCYFLTKSYSKGYCGWLRLSAYDSMSSCTSLHSLELDCQRTTRTITSIHLVGNVGISADLWISDFHWL